MSTNKNIDIRRVYIYTYTDIRCIHNTNPYDNAPKSPAISQSAAGKNICACAEKVPGTTKANLGAQWKCKWKMMAM